MRTVAEVFFNDADYPVQPRIAGKNIRCPYYSVWHSMAYRASGGKILEKRPTYLGVECCEDWLFFSNFKAWMETQHWEGMHLDKDILSYSDGIYSPDTCAFVPASINTLLLSSNAIRGDLPLGVTTSKSGRYLCQVRTGIRAERIRSLHDSPEEAHSRWQIEKAKIIETRSEEWKKSMCKSYREDVAIALLDRASTLRQNSKAGIETVKI